jgi:hypothetical protein
MLACSALPAPRLTSAATAPATAVVVAGTATLSVYPLSCSASLPGDFFAPQLDAACYRPGGTGFSASPVVPTTATNVTIDAYYEPCVPAVGSAYGSLSLAGGARYYSWYRSGLTSVLELKDGGGAVTGAAAGIFAPIPSATVHSCLTNTGQLAALVAVVGAST